MLAPPGLRESFRPRLSHVKERSNWQEDIEGVARLARARDGGTIPVSDICRCPEMKARVHATLTQLHVDTGDFAGLRAILKTRYQTDARHQAEKDATRGLSDGVQHEQDDLRVWVAFLDGRAGELGRQMVGFQSSTHTPANRNGRRFRHYMEEGPLGSHR